MKKKKSQKIRWSRPHKADRPRDLTVKCLSNQRVRASPIGVLQARMSPRKIVIHLLQTLIAMMLA